MSDYIDRQAAIEALNALCVRECKYSKKTRLVMCSSCELGGAFEVLDDFPSVDVVPVVRCKACANWNRETHGCLRNPSVSPWWEDDFCNYGARRDPEADYEWSEEEQAYIEQGYMDSQVGLPDLYMN